jgi:hypothetical protein
MLRAARAILPLVRSFVSPASSCLPGLARALCACLAILALAPGCGPSKPKTTTRPVVDLPPVDPLFRGLIGTEVQFRNIQPYLVSGYGIVVGVQGKGGQPLNEAIAATMERELGLMGITPTADALKGTPLEGKAAPEVLRHPDVAVVEILAAVPPGTPKGAPFDVQVRALNASSLEGGRLWTSELRFGPPAVFGGQAARRVAKARGEVFVNPFTLSSDQPQTAGRVLGGGEMLEPQPIALVLNAPSHTRARAIASAINSRFTPGPGDPKSIALGRTDTTIHLSIPMRYRRDPASFLRVIEHLQVDQSAPEAYARRYVEAIKQDAQAAERLSWALEGLGPRALPILRELYEFPELVPRLAGLRAGARLDDPRAAPGLQQVVQEGQGSVRTRAIALLAEVNAGPTVDATLRELLREPDLLVRIAAYEGLATRAERARFVYLSRVQDRNPDLARQKSSPLALEEVARTSIPPEGLRGIARMPVAGKFLLDRVDGGEPMIYVTLQGTPRVVLFGADVSVRPHEPVSLWEGSLMIGSGEGTPARPMLRVRYQRPQRSALDVEAPASLTDLVATLARDTRDIEGRPGLGMTYSQVVAVLAALQDQGATAASFATERDRLAGELLAAQASRDMTERPETPDDREAIIVRQGSGTEGQPREQQEQKPTVVPIR